MAITDYTIPLVTVALAELGDKSQILIFLLSSRTKKHLQLLLGVMMAFVIVDGFAIAIGSWIMTIIPDFWLKIVAGAVFVTLGVLMVISKKEEDKENLRLSNPLVTGFSMIFMAEWGDKTQIASALFATNYNPVIVFMAVMSALLLLSASAVYLGKIIAHKVNHHLTEKIAGVIFIILGVVSWLF